MQRKIQTFLDENSDLINENIVCAARESFSINDSNAFYEKVSVVLDDAFKIRVFRHHINDFYTKDIIYVLTSIKCESFIVDFEDIFDYLNEKHRDGFKKFIFSNKEVNKFITTNLYKDEIEPLSEHEIFEEVIHYMFSQNRQLDLLYDFDKQLYDKFINSIFKQIDYSQVVESAKFEIFDNLYYLEDLEFEVK